jgi:hypothetical protein
MDNNPNNDGDADLPMDLGPLGPAGGMLDLIGYLLPFEIPHSPSDQFEDRLAALAFVAPHLIDALMKGGDDHIQACRSIKIQWDVADVAAFPDLYRALLVTSLSNSSLTGMCLALDIISELEVDLMFKRNLPVSTKQAYGQLLFGNNDCTFRFLTLASMSFSSLPDRRERKVVDTLNSMLVNLSCFHSFQPRIAHSCLFERIVSNACGTAAYSAPAKAKVQAIWACANISRTTSTAPLFRDSGIILEVLKEIRAASILEMFHTWDNHSCAALGVNFLSQVSQCPDVVPYLIANKAVELLLILIENCGPADALSASLAMTFIAAASPKPRDMLLHFSENMGTFDGVDAVTHIVKLYGNTLQKRGSTESPMVRCQYVYGVFSLRTSVSAIMVLAQAASERGVHIFHKRLVQEGVLELLVAGIEDYVSDGVSEWAGGGGKDAVCASLAVDALGAASAIADQVEEMGDFWRDKARPVLKDYLDKEVHCDDYEEWEEELRIANSHSLRRGLRVAAALIKWIDAVATQKPTLRDIGGLY